MSKHRALTEEEFCKFKPPARTLHFIEEFGQKNGLDPSQVNVLDWGCGRGRAVLWFLERGYNSFGLDLDSETVENGRAFFEKRGFDPSRLAVISADGRSSFPANFFHCSYSNQVLEHVADLECVAQELLRITAPGGEGYHIFPPHRGVVEGHLFMPFVHWLPKNEWRRRLISLCVRVGCEPRWPELEGFSSSQKADAYHRYSVTKTFYRRPSKITATFRRSGFEAWFDTVNHPRVAKHRILGPISRNAALRPLLDHGLVSFVSVELHLRRLARG